MSNEQELKEKQAQFANFVLIVTGVMASFFSGYVLSDTLPSLIVSFILLVIGISAVSLKISVTKETVNNGEVSR